MLMPQPETSPAGVGSMYSELQIVSGVCSKDLNKLVCQAHADPDCNAVECIPDFFDEYSPFHDTLPEKNLGSKVERSGMSKLLPPTTTPPPVANVVDIRTLSRQHIGLLLASDTLDPDIRRPYMPLISRQFLKDVRAQPGVWRELFAGSGSYKEF